MTRSKMSRATGTAPEPAMAPSSTALAALPAAVAARSMSKKIGRLAISPAASRMRDGSMRPSLIEMRSAIAYMRCVEAIRVVRAGLT